MRPPFMTEMQSMVKHGTNQSLKQATKCTLLLFYVYFLLDNWKPILHATMHSQPLCTLMKLMVHASICVTLCDTLVAQDLTDASCMTFTLHSVLPHRRKD